MENGKLYFIKDDYLEKYNLSQNKGENHDRPFFCCFQDEHDQAINWVIPLTSKVERYEELYENYINKIGKCDVIDFIYIFNKKSAASIKNAFPITDKNIKNVYVNPITGEDVRIKEADRLRIGQKLKTLMAIQARGHNIFYNDVMEMKNTLLSEQQEQVDAEISMEEHMGIR